MNIETFKGENPIADHSIRLGKFLIKDFPLKPAGVASVTVAIIIKENLDLIVKARSNDTGNGIEANCYDKEIAKKQLKFADFYSPISFLMKFSKTFLSGN